MGLGKDLVLVPLPLVAYWTLAHVPLDQGTCLASKSPSGRRPDNILNRLGSTPGVARLMVDGVCTVLNVYLPHPLSLYILHGN